MSTPTELAPSNIFMRCRCGHEVEADGEIDFEIHTCSECHRVGCWVKESELWELPVKEEL